MNQSASAEKLPTVKNKKGVWTFKQTLRDYGDHIKETTENDPNYQGSDAQAVNGDRSIGE